MAERLTRNSKFSFYNQGNLDAMYDKLAELEDIMEEYGMVDIQDFEDCLESMYDESINAKKLKEFKDIMAKYGIERVEELECFLDDYSKNQGRDFAICEERDDLKKDRDTWKRACELACEREDDCYVYDNIHRAYEFYLQAKQVTGK